MKKYIVIISAFVLSSCNNSDNKYDASGTFEADEIMVVAEANGEILNLNLEEGQKLLANQQLGVIDPKSTELQKEQVLATISAIDEKTNSAQPQIQVLQRQYNSQKSQIKILEEQLKNAVREKNRLANLVKSDAATRKQLDDAAGLVEVINRQISAAETQLSTINQEISSTTENINIQNRAILSEKQPNQKKVAQIDDQMRHNIITSPIAGTVLTKYMYKGEYANIGKPIFKIADLNDLILRIYITGTQLTKVKLNQPIKVFVDQDNGKSKEISGKIIWISPDAEFTPKTIQTNDERANLVYACKVRVKNDGFLKIGMYGDVKF